MRALVETYLTAFCAGDWDNLAGLLRPDFSFKGPWLECGSSAAYLEVLRADDFEPSVYEIQHLICSEREAAVFYLLKKEGLEVQLAQFFGFKEGKIKTSVLVFDTQAFQG